MGITQEELKENIWYDSHIGVILRNRYVQGKGDKGDPMRISYNEYGYPYFCIDGQKLLVLKMLVLYEEGFIPKRCRFIDGDVTNLRYDNILYDPIDNEPTYDFVRKSFDYNPNSGILIRKIASNGFPANEEAGYQLKNGYKNIKILGNTYSVHRVIWLWMEGFWPEPQIDHIDRDPSNNKWENLRMVSSVCNIRNQGINSVNTTGVKGVCPYKDSGKYFVYVYINRKSYHIGSFTDFTEAVFHRLAAEQCIGWGSCDANSSAFKYIKDNVNPNIKECH